MFGDRLPARLEKFKSDHAGHLRQIALRGTFLDEEDVNQVLNLSIPGFDELMAFIEISALLENPLVPKLEFGNEGRIASFSTPRRRGTLCGYSNCRR